MSFLTVSHFFSWSKIRVFLDCSIVLFLEQTICLSWLFHISFPRTDYMSVLTVPHFCS
jgi:hypothetical protein